MDTSTARFVPPELRVALRGRRAFLISNRRERGIERWLLEQLGVKVAWIDCNRTRKLEAARAALSCGTYDLVLVVTGFVGHSVDRILKPMCKQTGTLFIPVGKGRPRACLDALARHVNELDAGSRGE